MHRLLRVFPLVTGLGLSLTFGAASCAKVPLLAPTGTVINLTVASSTAALNSSINIIAVLIENGQQSTSGTGTAATSSSTTGAGTPVQDGTVVSFTTSIGTIEPAEAKTVNGKVAVALKTSGESGTATITAYSGGAKSTSTIKIGAANAKTVTVSASPQNLASSGGSTIVSALVVDESGNGLAGATVSFSTTKGSLSATTGTTNSSGIATTVLTTTGAADVTATIAAISGKVTIGVSSKATVSVTGPTGAVSVSAPASFSINVGTTVPVSNVTINYGDGSSKTLGAISGTQSVTHTYAFVGIFDVTVSATDADGIVTTSSTQVAVTGISGSISASASSITRGTPVTFTASVLPSTTAIDHYSWDFGDLTSADSTSNVQSHVYALTTASGTLTVTVRVYPQTGSSFTMSMQISIPTQKGSITLSGPTSGTTSISTAVTYSIDVGSTVALTNITLDYGDGSTPRALGSFSGSRTDTKFYSVPSSATASGAYTVTASGRDPDGNTVTSSLTIVVQKLNGTLAVTTGGSSLTPTQLTFTIASGQTTALIDRYFWDFNDAPAAGATWESTSNVSPTHQYTRGVWLAKVTVYPVYGAAFTITVQVPIN